MDFFDDAEFGVVPRMGSAGLAVERGHRRPQYPLPWMYLSGDVGLNDRTPAQAWGVTPGLSPT